MRHFIQQHLPLLTKRIEFFAQPEPAHAPIASRIEFTEERINFAIAEQEHDSDEDLGDEHDIPRNAPGEGSPSRRRGNDGSKKIAKPQGEPGRPGSGGYNIEDELKVNGWTQASIKRLTVRKSVSISSYALLTKWTTMIECRSQGSHGEA